MDRISKKDLQDLASKGEDLKDPEKFFKYFEDFYSSKGLYPIPSYTKKDVLEGIKKIGKDFEGDSFDRERIRDMIYERNKKAIASQLRSLGIEVKNGRIAKSDIRTILAKFNVGDKVQITPGSGIDSDKKGVIVDKKEVKTDGKDVPSNLANNPYKPVDWSKEEAVKLEDGSLITMFKNRLKLIAALKEFGIGVSADHRVRKTDIQNALHKIASKWAVGDGPRRYYVKMSSLDLTKPVDDDAILTFEPSYQWLDSGNLKLTKGDIPVQRLEKSLSRMGEEAVTLTLRERKGGSYIFTADHGNEIHDVEVTISILKASK
jgi:hypothetical protein